jgi:hypothetical protein
VALTEVVSEVNDAEGEATNLLEDHASAARSLAEAQAEVERLQRDLAFYLEAADASQAAATQEALNSARAIFEQQQLRVNTFSTLYQESQLFLVDGDLVQPLSTAFAAGDSRSADMQLGIVGGLVGGVIAAMGAAWLVANARQLVRVRRSIVQRYRVTGQPPRQPSEPRWEPTDATHVVRVRNESNTAHPVDDDFARLTRESAGDT